MTFKFNNDQDYWANVFVTEEFICIDTYSGLGMTAKDYQYPSHLLPFDASDIEIGSGILQALSHSRSLTDREERAQFFDLAKNKEKYKDWINFLLENSDYRTKKSLFLKMKKCGIHLVNNVIVISPSRHEKLEAWGRTNGDGIEDVMLTADSNPAEIGAGLRLALIRCKG